jgi:hypothetical protein
MEKKNLTMAYVVLKKEPHLAYEKGSMIQTQDRMSRENTLYAFVAGCRSWSLSRRWRTVTSIGTSDLPRRGIEVGKGG